MNTPTLETKVYAYVVMYRVTHKKTRKTEEHILRQTGYNLDEATKQAAYELMEILGGMHVIEDYEFAIVSAGPDMQKLVDELAQRMRR